MQTQTHDVAKLPMWAQRRIRKLEADLALAKRELSAGPENSRVFANDYSDLRRRPLGDADVAFYPDGEDGGSIRCKLHDDGSLQVMGTRMGLVITPHASNVCHIRLMRF